MARKKRCLAGTIYDGNAWTVGGWPLLHVWQVKDWRKQFDGWGDDYRKFFIHRKFYKTRVEAIQASLEFMEGGPKLYESAIYPERKKELEEAMKLEEAAKS